jgi:hypothetical protein
MTTIDDKLSFRMFFSQPVKSHERHTCTVFPVHPDSVCRKNLGLGLEEKKAQYPDQQQPHTVKV